MNEHACDRVWEVDALREGRLGRGDADAFERHVRVCETCGEAQARARELDEWIQGANRAEMSALDSRRIRQRILRSVGVEAEIKPHRSRARAATVLAALACAGAFVAHRHLAVGAPTPIASVAATSGAPVAPVFLATVQAKGPAQWSRAQHDAVEHVRLDEGALSIRVGPHDARQSFVVDLPDGVLHDRGTAFDVEVHDGHTTRVSVSEGIVALDLKDAGEILLGSGATWPVQAPLPPRRATKTSSPPAVVAHARPDDGSAQYATGVALLRQRSYAAAAAAFDAYVRDHAKEPDAEDASYLEALALSQAGDKAGAMRAAEAHLSAYPQSFHRKEAAMLIARLARDQGDCAKARRTLAPWLGGDADAEAVATLRSCAER